MHFSNLILFRIKRIDHNIYHKKEEHLLLSEKDISDLELPKGDTRILMAAVGKVQAVKLIVSKYGTSRPHKP